MLIYNKNKKAQIGETMTWVVATLIIIVILGVSIFIVQFSLSKKEFVLFATNDLIVTKSVVSFLSYGSNFNDLENSINNDNYDLLKPRIEFFLGSISLNNAWDFRVFVNDNLKRNSVVLNLPDLETSKSYFQFNIGEDEIGLNFKGGKNE